jgi:hypothetical protein
VALVVAVAVDVVVVVVVDGVVIHLSDIYFKTQSIFYITFQKKKYKHKCSTK